MGAATSPSHVVDVAAILANDCPTVAERAALMVLATLHKEIPAQVDPSDPDWSSAVDWDALEAWSGPWSSTERMRVRLARSLAEGDLGNAAWLLDDRNWQVLLDALRVVRGGR